MPHFPKPFFRKSRNLWYVQVDGTQHNLGPDREVAFDRYHALMRQPAAKKVASDCVSSILDAFLDWTQQNRAPATYEWYVERTSSFCKTLPEDMRASDLKPLHVQRWLDQHPKWNNGMKRGAITAIKRAFHWAEKMGYVDRSPVAHMEKPQGGRRENVVTPVQYKELLTHVNDDAFRELLDTSWECGCRPQESLHVEARHVDRQNSRWVFPADESKGKKRIRVVYLTPNALAITLRLMAKHPTGPLFRNRDGNPWTPYSVDCRFKRLKKWIGRKIALYDFRHSFTQRLLEAGIDAVVIATLLGHADTSMLAKVYSHLTSNPQYLLDQIRRAAS